MHIPDNYLSPSTCISLATVMVVVWRRAVDKVKNEFNKRKFPLLGICAAFSFLIMMFNIPLPGGTTGHAVGSTLVAILLGPYAAVISITVALAIQALFFGDGGILAFGVNAFNMAFIMPFIGYYIFKLIKGKSENKNRNYIAAFFGAYISINAAAFLAAIEFGIQPILFKSILGFPIYCPYPLKVTIPSMLVPHLLVAGVVEGIITAGVYMYVRKLSPEVIYRKHESENSQLRLRPIYALIATMIILCPLGLLASGTAWGEWSVEELKGLIGYVPQGMQNGLSYKTIFLDYVVTGLPETVGYIISAVLGVLGIYIIIKLINKKVLVVRDR
ncbi:cobalt transporter CbiM [Clostridium polyendosporum]|uniref:Cobalt transporter CbiM n=1 Tax=Clostridium polyendosporum TaxID=69208 RepID=A0A919VF62_9CLOT|nr:cobalt transporter CbiM [Clostridium polyendosporum]GIM28095.1 cobalt transporter CbiM [Clostridium polyendosporum]